MADLYNTNIYPPIISTYMPAFIRTDDCMVTFSMSSFNSAETIKKDYYAEIVLRRQNGSSTVLKQPLKENEIKQFIPIQSTINENGEEVFYITIKTDWLKAGEFELDTFYSLQIRFAKKSNSNIYSEWSTICLIGGIDKPILTLKGFDIGAFGSQNANTLIELPPVIDLIGRLSFNSNQEKTYMTSYRIKITNLETNELEYDSQTLYTDTYSSPNEINYSIGYEFHHNTKYSMSFEYTTNNLYNEIKEYIFFISDFLLDALNVTMETEESIEKGVILVNYTFNSGYKGKYVLRRTSNESNFTLWVDIYTDYISAVEGDIITFEDYSVASGIEYIYNIQRIDNNNNRGKLLPNSTEKKMVVFDNIFLQVKDKVLRIKYNESIESFKYNVAESRTDTIGSKYPYIRRNANIKYREFPISGTITYLMDLYETGDMELFNDSLNRESDIPNFLESNSFFLNESEDEINWGGWSTDEHLFYQRLPHEDEYVYEREFREAVMEFLYDGKLKLYKSTTEGNLIVKLMDITFTPEKVVGRKIYHFSANVIEVADCTLDNLYKYDLIYTNLKNHKQETSSDDVFGMIKLDNVSQEDNIIDLIQSKYNNYIDANGISYRLSDIYQLRLEFNSSPNSILSTDDVLSVVKSNGDYYGYLIDLNENQTLINSNGFYEIDTTGVPISSIYVNTFRTIEEGKLIEDKASLNVYYYGKKEVAEESSTILKSKAKITKLGQIKKIFKYNESVLTNMQTKYNVDYNDYYQTLVSIDYVDIEAEEGTKGTILYRDENNEVEKVKFVIGRTQRLILDKKDNCSIDDIIFEGSRLIQIKDNELEPREHEYKIYNNDKEYDLNTILPKANYVYKSKEFDENTVRAYTEEQINLPETEIEKNSGDGVIIIGDEVVVGDIHQISETSDFWQDAAAEKMDKLSQNKTFKNQSYVYKGDNFYLATFDENNTITVDNPVNVSVTYLCTLKGEQY